MIELKDVFTKEDPQELNIKLNNVQCEKQKVINALIIVGDMLAKCRKEIHKYLRANYQKAIEETKKNAGIEALELWAASKMVCEGTNYYEEYIYSKEKFSYLDKVRISYDNDISGLQSRINIFKEVQ